MSPSILCFDDARLNSTPVMEVMWANALFFRNSEDFQVTPELVYFVLYVGKHACALERFKD